MSALIGRWEIGAFLYTLGVGNRRGERASWDTIRPARHQPREEVL